MHASVLMMVILAAAAARPTVEEATRAYRAGRYAEACRLFQQAVDETPADGERWSDLGLCLGKLGRKAEAVAAEIRAAELGERETRLHAYYNLGTLGVRLPLPATPGGKCQPIRSSGACAETGTVCPYDVTGGGTSNITQMTGWLFCPTGVRGDGYFPFPETLAQRDCFHLQLTFSEEGRCGGPEGAECPSEDAGPTETKRECAVVFLDACHHRAGAVCKNASKRETVEVASDALFPPPFDAFTPTDAYRALHHLAPGAPLGDVSPNWLQQQKVVQREGQSRLVTLSSDAKGATAATWTLDQDRLRLLTVTDLSAAVPGHVTGELRFSPEGRDVELLSIDASHPATRGRELFVFRGYDTPRLVLRRVHDQGWSGLEPVDPRRCQDFPANETATADGGRITFQVACYDPAHPAQKPKVHVEAWRWTGERYEREKDLPSKP